MDGTTDIPLSMLKNLGASMAVMEAAEQKDRQNSGNMETMGNRSPRPKPMSESAMPPRPKHQAPKLQEFPDHGQLLTELPEHMRGQQTLSTQRPMNETAIQNSNLSPEIKKLMLEHQIEDPATHVAPDLNISENVRTDLMETEQRVNVTPSVPASDTHGSYQQPIADANAIRQIVREEIREVMSETYAKKIREETIRKTLKSLKSKGLLK